MATKGMSTTAKIIVWVGVLATVGVSGYIAHKLYVRYKDKKAAEKNGTADTSTTADAGIIATVIGNTPKTCKHCIKEATFPLMKGSQGKQVAAVQYAYNSRFPNKTKLTVDGDWGKASESAFITLFGGTSSANGWNNTTGAVSGAGAALTGQGVKIDKTLYDKYFKGFENF